MKRRHLLGTPWFSTVANYGRRGIIKSIQTGTIAIAPAATTNTATITAVSVENTLLLRLSDSLSTGSAADGFAYLQLTNATTVTATRGSNSGTLTVGYLVIEYVPGVIKSIQQGTIVLASVATNTATVTAVDLRNAVLHALGALNDDSASSDGGRWFVRLTLTDATTITATRGSATGNATVGYRLVEWF